MQIQGSVGPAGPFAAGTQSAPIRQGAQGDLINSELHGRFYEQCFRGNLYSGGMTLTSISNATFTTGTLSASCTPITGLWNPVNSGVNAVILQANIGVVLTALTATGCGGFVWATSIGNGVITTGNAPLNRKTLNAAGSQVKDMTGVALTGLTTSLTVRMGSALGGGSIYDVSEVATAAGFLTTMAGSVENLDGSIIVPPGGVLALLATVTPVAHSAVAGLIWEEVSITGI